MKNKRVPDYQPEKECSIINEIKEVSDMSYEMKSIEVSQEESLSFSDCLSDLENEYNF